MCLFTMQKKVVIVDDIVNVLLPIKFSGKKVYSFPKSV